MKSDNTAWKFKVNIRFDVVFQSFFNAVQH